VGRELRDLGHRNVIVNIANEQNSEFYENLPWRQVRDPDTIIKLCQIFKNESGVGHVDSSRTFNTLWFEEEKLHAFQGLLCGGGGYVDGNNIVIGKSDSVDALLFDTQGREDEWHTMHFYSLYRQKGIRKPMVNVEVLAGWTE